MTAEAAGEAVSEAPDARSHTPGRPPTSVLASRLGTAVVALSASFYAVFIVRSDVSIAGKSYYGLIDDSMISMTFARNLAHGHGLVWQPGDRVEGYTNTLWTLWMAVIHLLPFSDAVAGLPIMITGAGILIATVLVVARICRQLVPDRPLVAPAAMLLVGLCYPLAFWTLRGMEAGLCALLLAVAVQLTLGLRGAVGSGRLVGLGAVLAAAVLTRDDMLFPGAVVVAFAVYWSGRDRRGRVLAVVGGALVGTIAAHTVFRLAYYGDALPNTYYLKLGGVPLGTRLHRGLVEATWVGLTTLGLTIALAVIALLCARRTARLPALAFVGAVFVSQCLYSVYVGGDFAEQPQAANRFVVTALPLVMVLAAIGISDLVRRAGEIRARRAGIALAILILVAAAVLIAHGWGATRELQFAGSGPYEGGRVMFVLLAAAVLASLAIGPSTSRPRAQLVVAGALLLLTLATVNYGPLRSWAEDGPSDLRAERFEIRRAVEFRRFSAPSSSVALIAAGNGAYFSHRPTVDLLGKMDRVIAHGPNHLRVFRPGHTKWNYDYSIGRLRPDAVNGLLFPTARDLCNLARWGYREIAPRYFVRSDARAIDVPRLSASLSRFDRRPLLSVPAGCARGP